VLTRVVLVEEQRTAAWRFLRDRLPALANHGTICSVKNCKYETEEHSFPEPLFRKMQESGGNCWAQEALWPSWEGELTLRTMFVETGGVGDIAVYGSKESGHEVRGEALKDLCMKASQIACGLCLTCLRDKTILGAGCAHGRLCEYSADSDPIFLESVRVE
jgi:hypothetical protein